MFFVLCVECKGNVMMILFEQTNFWQGSEMRERSYNLVTINPLQFTAIRATVMVPRFFPFHSNGPDLDHFHSYAFLHCNCMLMLDVTNYR